MSFFISGGLTPLFAQSNLFIDDSYTVTVTDFNSCEQTQTVTIDLLSGFSEIESLLLTLYPNPVQDKLFIDWRISSAFNQIQVFDILGREIDVTVELSERNARLAFDQKLTGGIYYVDLEIEDGRKIIRQFLAE